MLKIRKNNRKITFLILGCAILSLGSIGFSTWILSLGDGSSNLTVNVSVETVYNETRIVEIKDGYTESIDLGLDNSTKIFDLGLSANLIVSDDEINKVTDISATITAQNSSDKSDKKDYNKVVFKEDTVGQTDVFGRTIGDDYTYLSLTVDSIAINKDLFEDYQNADGYKSYEISFDDLAIQYGSFFNNQTPEDFYTDKIDELKNIYDKDRSDVNLDNYLNAMSLAKQDIESMRTSFANKNVVITLAL